MSAAELATLAIDASFDIHGVDAVYAWGGIETTCRVLPAQPDVEFGMDVARVQIIKSEFMLRASQVAAPQQSATITVAGVTYKIKEAPAPDDLRLLWRLKCVKA